MCDAIGDAIRTYVNRSMTLTTLAKKWLGKIHNGDCIEQMRALPDGAIDLVFADPPFNIGFKYDQYQDRLEDDKYLAWSHDWISEVYRTLKNNGTFWLAIGDEYAAELKVAAQKIGFHCRSWVIWYYTFGVHCEKKFTRSHAHMFHFVKDKTDFVFNHTDKDLRVPSARQLVYNDSRANPKGRMPDDTWILRPQDLVDGFNPDEDTWYFPRVAGTFKEREGFHGCQMPEQLLGRIIRSCSNPNDIVVDPFSGSATTLAVAKKMGRQFFGFELSKDYVALGTKRLDQIVAGDKLDGAEEPKVSAPRTDEKKNRGKRKNRLEISFDSKDFQHLNDEKMGLIEAFSSTNRGFSVDRIVSDPLLNDDFQTACDKLGIPGSAAERNRFLFRIRKAGVLNHLGIKTKSRTSISWNQISSFIYASEIAWRQISSLYCMSLDEIFCDPRIASQFDEVAAKFAPGYRPLEYRWAALKLRKEGHVARERSLLKTPRQLGISQLNKKNLKDKAGLLISELDYRSINQGPGVYLVNIPGEKPLYAGETKNLKERIQKTFDPSGPLSIWLERSKELQLFLLELGSISDLPFARQTILLKWHKPEWNQLVNIAV